MGLKDRVVEGSGLFMKLVRMAVRFLQFVLAVFAAGLYSVHEHSGNQTGGSMDSRWIYAIVVGGTAALTSVIYTLPKVPSRAFFAWDGILWLLWIIVFGIFGKLYIGEKNPHNDPEIARMKVAIWLDVANVALWFCTAVYGGITFWLLRKGNLPKSRSEV